MVNEKNIKKIRKSSTFRKNLEKRNELMNFFKIFKNQFFQEIFLSHKELDELNYKLEKLSKNDESYKYINLKYIYATAKYRVFNEINQGFENIKSDISKLCHDFNYLENEKNLSNVDFFYLIAKDYRTLTNIRDNIKKNIEENEKQTNKALEISSQEFAVYDKFKEFEDKIFKAKKIELQRYQEGLEKINEIIIKISKIIDYCLKDSKNFTILN